MAVVATGRIVRFDEARGYGFIAQDGGGEDVFLHANALVEEKRAYRAGTAVEFEIVKDARGLKAVGVRVHGGSGVSGVVRTAGAGPSTGEPATAAVTGGRAELSDDEGLCDVLTSEALRQELVQLCLDSVPSMTGEQITRLNVAVIALGRRHGWVED